MRCTGTRRTPRRIITCYNRGILSCIRFNVIKKKRKKNRRDDIIPPRVARRSAAAVQGPPVRVVTLPQLFSLPPRQRNEQPLRLTPFYSSGRPISTMTSTNNRLDAPALQ